MWGNGHKTKGGLDIGVTLIGIDEKKEVGRQWHKSIEQSGNHCMSMYLHRYDRLIERKILVI